MLTNRIAPVGAHPVRDGAAPRARALLEIGYADQQVIDARRVIGRLGRPDVQRREGGCRKSEAT